MRTLLVALCLVFGCASAVQFVFCQRGINLTTAMAAPSDQVEVYYMQAPAFEGMFGNLFKGLGGYHTALGIVNRNTNASYTLEYDAVSEVLNATLPIVTRTPNGTVQLNWYNRGHNCLQPGLNATYYNVGQQLVTTVNGTVWNRLLQWTVGDNATYGEYQLSYVVDEWRGPRNTTFFINSSTCYDFNWRAFQALYDFGAKLNYSQVLKHDYINYYTSVPPVPVDYNDIVWRERINKYYEAWDFHRHDIIEDLLLFLEDILLGDKFLFANGRYYWLQDLHRPYFKNVYDYQCLPGQDCSKF